jgi:hypothetical protein
MPLIFIQATELPYVSHAPTDGRKIPILHYYHSDADRFFMYSLQPNGKILVLPGTEPQEGSYIAKAAANPELDYRLILSETLIQHFSFDDIAFTLNAIEQDLVNGLASLHEYFVLLNYANEHKDQADHFIVGISIEYAFGNHRSFYDLLHEVIGKIHRRFQVRAPNMQDSFENFATKSRDELRERFLFPQPIIDFYKSREEIFLKLREIRTHIYHDGLSPDISFKFPDGFAFRVDDRFAANLGDLNLWPAELLKPDRLGSVLAILEYLERDMLDAASMLSAKLLESFPMLPQPIALDHQIFFRSLVSKHRFSLDAYKHTHWFDPKIVLGL